MKFQLPTLPYAHDALEPIISEQTLEFHYGKHHQAYVNNLNNLIEGTEFENATLEDIVIRAEGGIFNNGAQVWNHTFYFFQFAEENNGVPSGNLMKAINKKWGSFDQFKETFSKAAATLFGSGWAWLVKNGNDELEIICTQNAESPLRNGLTPILTCDVWEHAYYLDKQNARPKYIEDFWKIINWNTIEERFN